MKQIKALSIKDIPPLYRQKIGFPKKIEKQTARILQRVRSAGNKAVLDYTARFDGVKLKERSLKIPNPILRSIWNKTPFKIKKAINASIRNIQKFHSRQMPHTWKLKPQAGTSLGQFYQPLERIGIYIPGGTAPLISTVLMTTVPAKIAGVKEIIITTPPKPNRYILSAAYKAGADKVYQIGGAQAVAAMAYGTETIPKVDKIIGPGNIYVTCAKKLVFGEVGIDLLAGPSEILIIADKTANPEHITADLLSQLEHDPLSKAVLITDSSEIYNRTPIEIRRQIKNLKRRQIVNKASEKGLLVIKAPNLISAAEIANEIAPEHLELIIKNPESIIKKIKNAGIILIGRYTPPAVSDFLAGTNHVLPTSGTARSFSGLSVWDFLKPIGTVQYTREALKKAAPYINTFAEIEGLDGHAKSVKIRENVYEKT